MFIRSYKLYVTALLLIIYVFNQIDRMVFSILMEPIKRDLSLSDSQLGFLAGPALAVFYATLGIPIARWADRGHRVNIMSGAIGLWSAVVILSAVAAKFTHLALARIGVGIGEAGFTAIAQSVIADYHTSCERTRALSVFMLGVPLGGFFSSLMGGWVQQAFGWRTVFIAAGLPGLVLALLVKWTVKEPLRQPDRASEAENPAAPSLLTVIATVWRRPALRHLALAMGLMNLVAGGVVGWNATFFIRLHQMSTAEVGTWFAFNSAIGGGLGVWLSGSMGRLSKHERVQAKTLATSAALAWLALMGVLLWPTGTGAMLFSLVANFLLVFFYAPSFSLIQSLCPPSMRATVLSMVIFLQILFAAVIGLQLTGFISDSLAPSYSIQGLRWAMMILAPAALWAALHFWLASRSVQRDLSNV
jgi:MFS family permease